MQPIGVLGGMGPEATILFMQKVIDAVDASDDRDHVPLIVMQNTQVPSRIAALIEGTGDDPGPALQKMARQLHAAGAVALAMPCNTAHHYAQQISDAVDIPFLNMVDLAVAQALTLSGSAARVGLLGSPALRRVGSFEPALARAGLSAVYSDHDDRVLAIIRTIKANGTSPQTAAALREIAQDLADKGADCLCICCTEFSLHAGDLASDLVVFDALDCLVAATVEAAQATP